MRFTEEAEFSKAAFGLVERISALMEKKGAKAACAESLTGGLIASSIVGVPGVSAWFLEG